VSPKYDSRAKRRARQIQKETGMVSLGTDQVHRIHHLIDHLTGYHLSGSEMAARHKEISSALAAQHPFLTELDIPRRGEHRYNVYDINAWLAEVCDKHGTHLDIRTDPAFSATESAQ
jgi:hypothetical protein